MSKYVVCINSIQGKELAERVDWIAHRIQSDLDKAYKPTIELNMKTALYLDYF